MIEKSTVSLFIHNLLTNVLAGTRSTLRELVFKKILSGIYRDDRKEKKYTVCHKLNIYFDIIVEGKKKIKVSFRKCCTDF